LLRRTMSPSNNVGKPEPGVAPPGGKRPLKSLVASKRPVVNQPGDNAPPAWAMGLMAQIENLNSRLGLIESDGFKPKSFSEAAASAATSPGGGVPLASVAALPQPAPSAKAETPKPPKGQSGSGYTRIPNGKLVRNKRPAAKPLPLRQAKNWRSRATTSLVDFLKRNSVGPDDPKPMHDVHYRELIRDLEYSKAYLAYVRKTDEPVEVHDWKSNHPPPNVETSPPRATGSPVNKALPSGSSEPIPHGEASREADESEDEEEESEAEAPPPSPNRSPPQKGSSATPAPATRSRTAPLPSKGKGKAN